LKDGLGRQRTVEDYSKELSAAEIPYTVEDMETTDYQTGKVVKLSVSEGTKIDLENPITITIYRAVMPELTSSDVFGDMSSQEEGDSSQPEGGDGDTRAE